MIPAIRTAIVPTCLLAFVAPAASQMPAVSTEILLHRAADYIATYERQMSLIVSEERYMQTAGSTRRVLGSDLLVVDLGVAGWFGFRDVFEVDGHAVRDHQNRLLALVTSPAPDPIAQAKRLVEEGARFNVGNVVRTINTPTLALMFLRAVQQPRSTWTLGGTRRIQGHEAVEVRFAERELPRVIQTRDDAPATGRFWIEPDSGRIVRSELVVDSAGTTAVVTVTFGPAPNVGPWVPLTMDDEYRPTNPSAARSAGRDPMQSFGAPGVTTIEGHATYRNFRTFSVETNTIIRK
jgi:hypothetical protein